MLGLRQFVCIGFMLLSICAWSVGPEHRLYAVRRADSGFQEFLDIRDRMEAETDLQAMVDLLKELKILCETKKLEFPNLTTFLSTIREKLTSHSLNIDDATFEWLYDEFLALEDFDWADWDPIRHKSRSHKKHKSKEVKISTKTALGFLKFMGGALLCIIPIPVVQGAGAGLAAMGISDMVDGCHGDKSSSLAEERMRSLQQSPANG